jgi:hypothetical protein
MINEIATPSALKAAIAVNTGNHVLASPLVSKDVANVEKLSADFIANKIVKN